MLKLSIDKIDFIIVNDSSVNQKYIDSMRPICDYIAIPLGPYLGTESIVVILEEIKSNRWWYVTSRFIFISTEIVFE